MTLIRFMKKVELISGLFLLTMASNSYAVEPPLSQTLVRIITQLNAIMPLLDEAQTEINPTSRIQFHIDSFKDANGQLHQGLRHDLTTIREALIDYLNQPTLTPKTIKPLTLDFIQP